MVVALIIMGVTKREFEGKGGSGAVPPLGAPSQPASSGPLAHKIDLH